MEVNASMLFLSIENLAPFLVQLDSVTN